MGRISYGRVVPRIFECHRSTMYCDFNPHHRWGVWPSLVFESSTSFRLWRDIRSTCDVFDDCVDMRHWVIECFESIQILPLIQILACLMIWPRLSPEIFKEYPHFLLLGCGTLTAEVVGFLVLFRVTKQGYPIFHPVLLPT